MEALSAEVHESCSAAVLDRTEIVYVLRVPTHKIMTINLSIGSRLPAYCTSMGRVLLAALDDDALDATLNLSPLHAHTPRTVTDSDDSISQAEFTASTIVDRVTTLDDNFEFGVYEPDSAAATVPVPAAAPERRARENQGGIRNVTRQFPGVPRGARVRGPDRRGPARRGRVGA